MNDRIFLSYRVGDTDCYVNFWSKCIKELLGEENVYEYKTSNHPGEDFQKRLYMAISRSDYLFAFIGKNWDRGNKTDIDWVEKEILDAADAKITIIPIYFDGVTPEVIKNTHIRTLLESKHSIIISDESKEDKFIIVQLLERLKIKRTTILYGALLKFMSLFLTPEKFIANSKINTIYIVLWMMFIAASSTFMVRFMFKFTIDQEQNITDGFIESLLSITMDSIVFGIVFFMLTIPSSKSLKIWSLKERFMLGYIQIPVALVLAALFILTIPAIMYGVDDARLYWGMLAKNMKVNDSPLDALGNWIDTIHYDDPSFLRWHIVGQLLFFTVYIVWQIKSIRVVRKIFRYSSLTPVIIMALSLMFPIFALTIAIVNLS